ncbi:MAG: DNA polymerase III subunit delta [Rhizobiales bacterium]|nr:DNA polymerase III subunit delta [Hyphomicrobiales bacterium]
MVALKTAEIENFVARPDPASFLILVFGPDAGLVRERTEHIIRASVDDPNDPFSLVRIDGDELASNPARLIEESGTVPLFGGRRAILVKSGNRSIVPAVEAAIAAPSPDCRIVIEAGDLRRGTPLRTLCERAKSVIAIPCYTDGERDLGRLVDEEMRAAGLTIAPDARAALLPLLGGDRAASRSEIRKVALYAHGSSRVTLDDVVAVIADASALAVDGLVDAVFTGRTADVELQFAKTRASGVAPGSIVTAALRQLAQLHRARLAMEDGATAGEAMRVIQPPVHFRREAAVGAALQVWTAARLQRAMGQLAEAALQTRQQPGLAETLAHRALLAIAANVRRN